MHCWKNQATIAFAEFPWPVYLCAISFVPNPVSGLPIEGISASFISADYNAWEIEVIKVCVPVWDAFNKASVFQRKWKPGIWAGRCEQGVESAKFWVSVPRRARRIWKDLKDLKMSGTRDQQLIWTTDTVSLEVTDWAAGGLCIYFSHPTTHIDRKVVLQDTQSSLRNMLIQARKNLMEWKTWPHYDKSIRIHCLCSFGDKQMQCIVDIVLLLFFNIQ